jgi:GDP-fucose transporter C1
VSSRAIGCCLIITVGYFAGLDQEGLSGGITLKGIIFGVLSSCCVSLNSIYTKKTLPFVDDSVWTLNYYNNLNASLMFIPLMFIFGELPHTVFVTQMTDLEFWGLMSLGGVMGVLIGFVTGLQIKVCFICLLISKIQLT